MEPVTCGAVAIHDEPCQLEPGHDGAHRWEDEHGTTGTSWHNDSAPEVFVNPPTLLDDYNTKWAEFEAAVRIGAPRAETTRLFRIADDAAARLT